MPPASVFIVEDEAIVANDIRETLISLGYCVAGTAKEGKSAIKKVAETKPDLVLMDIHLAGAMDGVEVAGQIQATYNVPIIYLTAYADNELLGRAKITGAYGYILKPFDERQLHSAIEMAIYKHRMEEQVKEKERVIRVLANAIPDAIVLLDHNQQIIALNDAMARRLGNNNTWTDRDSAVMFDQKGMFTSIQSQIEETLRLRRPVRFEEKSGDEWFDISLNPIIEPFLENAQVLVQYHNVTDHKRFEERLKKEGITQIEQNMEQFQILNDQIRNPLQAIMGYVNLDCIKYRTHIITQIGLVDNLVDRLDRGWIESEKVRTFLLRHYRYKLEPPADPSARGKRGGNPE